MTLYIPSIAARTRDPYSVIVGEGGYAIEHENHPFNASYSQKNYAGWRKAVREYEWKAPKSVDPREWYIVHSQGSQSSCQGQSLGDDGEYLNLLAHGKVIQLSRGFSYLASQEFDGLIGRDSGSTLSGGTRAAARGIPLESAFEYSQDYRSQLGRYRSQKSELLAGDVYKYPGALKMQGADDCHRFLSTFSGVIQIGIGWSLGSGWEHTSYRRGGGGHAVTICGYLVRDGWPNNIGFLLKNSWGKGWGREGFGLIHPDVMSSWCRSQTVIGRSDLEAPRPGRQRGENVRSFGIEITG